MFAEQLVPAARYRDVDVIEIRAAYDSNLVLPSVLQHPR